ncbi:sushi, von Willebrand factor type A, EGF and pentraxin domain-containing protein 1-like isoform X1 [Asterias amurensis]|uniref:sushi, von Willebrand factor type A, EGF and pentraxin domain-containing protein 1-like isoform X1 n=1 Tax=Asterias amurensis TaxID=7602 RepID=UPI003AB2E837
MATARLMYLLLMLTANLVAFEANQEPENDCIFDESAAAAASIGCNNKRCSLDTDVCNANRQCVCDGVCGYRCININNRKLCPPLPAPVNGSVVYKTNRAHGAKATYKCSPGYSLVNSTERTCLGDGQWTMDAAPTCLPNDEICPRLESLTNTSVGNGSGCLPACTRQRDCPKKTQQICTCRGTCGMSCVNAFVQGYCPDIEVAEGTIILSVTPRGNMYTSVAIIGCDDGYEMDTETQTQEISCMLTGQWNAQPARCTETVLCSPPPKVENARHNSRSRTFSPGDVLSYSCLAGYHHYGNAETSICLEDKLWTPVVMKCYAKSCGDPGFLRNGWRDGELFTFLSRVIYHCNEGYEMRGFAYRTCLSDRRWSSVMPSCEAIECPALFAPDHGTVQGTRYDFNEQVYFACKDGYRLEGSPVRQCQADQTWSGEEVTCTVVRCPEPEVPEHGFKIAPRLGMNAIVRYFCNEGYSLVGSRTARCTMEETWSNLVPECKADCTILNPPHHGSYDRFIPGRTVTHGTVIQINCARYYSLNSNEEYMCDDGQWSFHAKCDAAPCTRSQLTVPLNGDISYQPEVNLAVSKIPHGTTASYSCLYGYEQQGPTVTVSCHYGSWNQHTPSVCRPKPCDKEFLLHGRVVYNLVGDPHHGTIRTIECSEGFNLGRDVSQDQTCNNGFWTSPLPYCQPNACSTLTVINGDIRYVNKNLNHGETAYLTCNAGLKPSVGDGQVRCHAGHWVPADLQCISNDKSFNIAYGKPAVHTFIGANTWNASLAVDGDRSTDYNHGSCTDTRNADNEIFWRVDLQDIYIIKHVEIYNRQDCCEGRLSEASIHVGLSENEPQRQCGLQKISTESVGSQQPIHVDCAADNLYGQYITIRLPNNKGKMNLCEVEVFGDGPVKTCKVNDDPILKVSLKDTDLRVYTVVAATVKVYYNCTEGYTLLGSPVNRCNKKGQWNEATPTCHPDGCSVVAPENGQLDQSVSRINHDRSVAYSCDSPYIKLHDEVVCKTGQFEPGPPTCIPKNCLLDASQFTNVHVFIDNQELSLDEPVTIDHGRGVTFSCKTGFQVDHNTNTQTTCRFGELNSPIPTCTAVHCQQPPFMEHGSYSIVFGDSSLTYKTSVRYQCDQGYMFQTGDLYVFRRCSSSGNWGEDLPSCQSQAVSSGDDVQECRRPSIQQALIYHQRQNIAGSNIIFVNGDAITIRCSRGFIVNGKSSTTCRNGNWQPSLPSCEASAKQSCRLPDRIDNIAQYKNGKDKIENIAPSITVTHGGSIVSRCRNPLVDKLMTSAIRTCNDEQWIGEMPRCERAESRFQLPYLANMRYQYYANGTLLIYPGIGQLAIGCRVSHPYKSSLDVPHREHIYGTFAFGKHYGQPREEHSGVYVCQRLGGTFQHSLDIQVRAISCPEPEPLTNGRRHGDEFTITQSVSFECNEGYELQGDSIFKCNLGQWSPSFFPSCRSLNCPAIISDDQHMIVESGGTLVGSNVAFQCLHGYRLVGADYLVCQSGGTWSNSYPHCEERAEPTTTEPAVLECGGDCEIWERCVGTDQGQRICSCIHPTYCEEEEERRLYCGTDGNEYTSFCKLKATGCLLDQDIEVDYVGLCSQDNLGPVFSFCPNDTITYVQNAWTTATVDWMIPSVTNISGVSPEVTSNYAPNSTFSVGTTLVQYTATDIAGNQTTCGFNVLVIVDSVAPVISDCPADRTETLNTGASSVTITWVEPTMAENTGVFTMTNSHQSGDAFFHGSTTVTYTLVDIAGNQAICSFVVTVIERAEPTTTEPAVLDCRGDCEIWERCVGTDQGQRICSCIHPTYCEEEEERRLYCGTDGNEYTSICKLKATGCLLDQVIEVDYVGQCSQG